MTNPDVLKLAREIATQVMSNREMFGHLGQSHAIAMDAAILAIERATEAAAKLLDERRDERFAEYGTTEPDTNHSYYSGRYGETLEALGEENEALALVLRNFSHLKG